MVRPLDGPRRPAKSGTTKQLVVFLHGYGADGNDLIDLADSWAPILPDCAFVSPHAPEPCAGSPTGRQWFGLTFRDPDERWNGCVKAAPDLDAFLDQELARLGLGPDNLALVGFSQGTMMALHVGMRRAVAPASIVGFSGHLVRPERLVEDATAKPPVLLIHGDQDQVLPIGMMFEAAEGLAKAGIPAEWHLSRGIGHGIDQGGLIHGGSFLAQRFGLKLPA